MSLGFGWMPLWMSPCWSSSLFQVLFISWVSRGCKMSLWQIWLCFYQYVEPWKSRQETPKLRCAFWSIELIIYIYNPHTLFAPISLLRFRIPFSNAVLHLKFTKLLLSLEAIPHCPCCEPSFSGLHTYTTQTLNIREYAYHFLCVLFLYYLDWFTLVISIVVSPVSCKLYEWKWEMIPCF